MSTTPDTDQSGSDSKWVDRIQKLLAKAESTDHPEEAETLTAKAEQLMVKYAIDHAMLAASRKTDEKIIEKRIEHTGIYAKQHSQLALWTCMSLGNLRPLWSQAKRRNPDYVSGSRKARYVNVIITHIIGYESDVDAALVLVTSLMVQAQRAELAWWKSEQQEIKYYDYTAMEKFKMRRSFFIGFNEKVHDRLTAMRKKVVQEETSKTPGTDLVLRSRQQAVDTWVNQNYTLGGGRRGRGLDVDYSGLSAGQRAGATANLNQTGVGGQGGTKGQIGK